MESGVFLLGQWKNFEELEETLTLDELVQINNTMVDRENSKMEFQASIAGAKIKSGPKENKESQDGETLRDKIARSKEERQVKEGSKPGGAKDTFGQGQGYRVIGGR